jgi:hypothetical protein
MFGDFFNNLLRKLKIDANLTKITGTLNEILCTYIYDGTSLNSAENEKIFG